MTALPEHVKAELAEQRRVWWSVVGQIATGIFFGLVAFAVLLWLAAEAYVDLAL